MPRRYNSGFALSPTAFVYLFIFVLFEFFPSVFVPFLDKCGHPWWVLIRSAFWLFSNSHWVRPWVHFRAPFILEFGWSLLLVSVVLSKYWRWFLENIIWGIILFVFFSAQCCRKREFKERGQTKATEMRSWDASIHHSHTVKLNYSGTALKSWPRSFLIANPNQDSRVKLSSFWFDFTLWETLLVYLYCICQEDSTSRKASKEAKRVGIRWHLSKP